MPQHPTTSDLFVTKLIAGTGVTLSPASGTGHVTVSASDAAEFASPPALGNVAPNAVHATTLSATGAVTGAGVDALLASPTGPIGSTAPVAVHATTLSATGNAVLVTTQVGQLTTTQVGTFTANGASAVTVSDTKITAGSTVIFTLKTVGGTVGAYPSIKTITAATGFTVACTASDTSVYNYAIIG